MLGNKRYVLFFLLVVTLLPSALRGQNIFTDPREAENDYRAGNYLDAMKAYKKLLEQEPGNVDYHYKTGLCYLKTNIDKSLSVTYFEWVTKQPKFDNEVWYSLGQAYHYAYRFEDAIQAFNRYKLNAGNSNRAKADKQIAECKTAEELISHPVNVSINSVSTNINSAYPDYYPLVSADESVLIFTTRRPDINAMHVEMDGYYSSDIFISQAVNGEWGKAKSIGELVNTRRDEEAVGINPSAGTLIIYIDNIKHEGTILYSEKKRNTYSKPVNFPDNINNGFQSSGDISADGNTLFFASERAGGYGGTDIYLVKKLPDGKWGVPQNAGSNINTPYNEDFPWFDSDSNALYFSSEGHNTMGDYDLFESVWLNTSANNWSEARNLGFPINTPDDDRSISFTKDHHAAYISGVRPGGKGDIDIYRVVFNDVPRLTIITGYVTASNNTKPVNAVITTINKKTKESLYFKPVQKTGHYVMALVPGTYTLQIDCTGYATYEDNMTLYDLSSFRPEIAKNFILSPYVIGLQPDKRGVLFSKQKP